MGDLEKFRASDHSTEHTCVDPLSSSPFLSYEVNHHYSIFSGSFLQIHVGLYVKCMKYKGILKKRGKKCGLVPLCVYTFILGKSFCTLGQSERAEKSDWILFIYAVTVGLKIKVESKSYKFFAKVCLYETTLQYCRGFGLEKCPIISRHRKMQDMNQRNDDKAHRKMQSMNQRNGDKARATLMNR